jgi:hypothetical protein
VGIKRLQGPDRRRSEPRSFGKFTITISKVRGPAVGPASCAHRRRAMASAIGPAVVANSRERGGHRANPRGGGGAAGPPPPRPGGLPLRGRGGGARLSPPNGDLRRRRRRPFAGLKPARASDRHPTGTRRQGWLGRSACGDRARSIRDAPFATIPYRLGFCYNRPSLPSCVSAACGS